VTKASVTTRLRELSGLFSGDEEAKEEAAVLKEWLKLSNAEADLKKRLREEWHEEFA